MGSSIRYKYVLNAALKQQIGCDCLLFPFSCLHEDITTIQVSGPSNQHTAEAKASEEMQ